MPSSVSLGAPCWTDGSTYSGLLLRQFWCATKLYDQGTASAVSVPSGVYPGGGQLAVTPGTGLAVNVAAGYCAVANATAGHGAYIQGLMSSGSLTVPSNATGSTRLDYVVVNVQDLNTSGSYSQAEYLTGTTSVPSVPSPSLILAEISVPNGASSISSGNITDLRTYAAPPGCLFPIANAAAAPAVPATQMMYDLATGLPVKGTGSAGSVAAVGYVQVAGSNFINTSAGGQGLSPGYPSSAPWGIGVGFQGYGYSTDGYNWAQMQVMFTADGNSDYEVYAKWQLTIPAEAYAGSGDTLSGCGVRFETWMDGAQVDACYQVTGDNPLAASGGGSMSWFSSAALGTTPSAGPHTASLYLQTSNTYVYFTASGVFVGDVHASGGTIFGAPGPYLAALTAENCILRVQAVPVAA